MSKRFYEYIDKIVYINLDKRVDRNNEIKREFRRVDIPENKIQRFPAILNKNGALGCTMSHIKVLQSARTAKYNNILVLEDDFNFIDNVKNIDKAFEKFFNSFPANSWDVVNLSRGAYQKFSDIGSEVVSKANHISTTSGYLVNGHFFDKIIENFREGCANLMKSPDPKSFAIDVWWQHLQKQSNWYIFNPSLGYQRDSFSDIENRVVNYTVFDKSIEFKNKSQCSVNIIGGLGNQMFQIASMYGVAYDNNLEPVVEKISSSPSVFNNRPVYWDSVMNRVNSISSSMYNKMAPQFNIIKEQNQKYTKIVVPHNMSFKMDGYFQSPKYFEHHRAKILELFKLSNNMNKTIEAVRDEIKDKSSNMQYVAVHVRRGDYLKLQHFHVVQNVEYYKEAMNLFKSAEVQFKFIIFSDDIQWCKDNLKFVNNIYYFEPSKIKVLANKNIPIDVLEMYLMASFDHNIIANSSFSWWGAWLNKSDDKKVIAPSKWFVEKKDNDMIKDIYCSDMIVIPQSNMIKPLVFSTNDSNKIGVSILMPIYNGIEFLEESYNSIMTQTYTKWQLIIGVNGHKSPESNNSEVYNTAKKYESSNVVIVEYDNNIKGKENTLNEMVKLAKYDTICILDVDDKWLPTKLEKQIKIWEKNNYDVVGTFMQYFGDITNVPKLPENIDMTTLFNVNPICNSSAMIRKRDAYWQDTVHTKNKYNNKEYNFKGLDDYYMWLELNGSGRKFYNVPEVLTMHRIHKQSAFNNTNANHVPKLLEYMKERYNRLITIVTCFYNIKSKFRKEKYYEWIENFLRLKSNLVIFMDREQDNETYELIMKHRKPENTRIICLSIEKWETYKYLDFWKYCNEIDIEKARHSPELYMLWNEKSYFVQKAIELNPFDSKWFFWTDIGCCRDKDISKIINYPSIDKLLGLNLKTNKMLLSYINQPQETDNILVDGIPKIFQNSSPTRSCNEIVRVQGGFFGGHIDCWNRFVSLYTQTLLEFIDNKVFAGKDQHILATIQIKHKEDVQFYLSSNMHGDEWFFFLHLLS